MSLSLNCPGCGSKVGEINDNKKEIYYYKGDDGNPICKNCGSGEFKSKDIIIGVVLIFLGIPILISSLVFLFEWIISII